MAIQLIGGNEGEAPFSRTFFNVTLGDLLEANGKGQTFKLTLYLSDGSTLDVCQIDSLSDQYLSVRAYVDKSDTCEMTVHLIPYGLIYRIEISPKPETLQGRVGFHWGGPLKKKSRS